MFSFLNWLRGKKEEKKSSDDGDILPIPAQEPSGGFWSWASGGFGCDGGSSGGDCGGGGDGGGGGGE